MTSKPSSDFPEFFKSLKITQHNFNKDAIKRLETNDPAKDLRPLVYILSDRKLNEAYVGESTNFASRMQNHLKNRDRSKLTKLLLIRFDKFNKSATLEIEANLIKYISGDGNYKLQNGNAGLVLHYYYQDEKYFDVFKRIWSLLQKKGIAEKDLKDIDITDLYKFSPYKSLGDSQYQALEDITRTWVNHDKGSTFVSGSAGTGKTVLAIFLMKLLKTDAVSLFDTGNIEAGELTKLISDLKSKYENPKIALVVPMAPLRTTLKRVFRNIKGLQANMVISPSEASKAVQRYDILIVDEAHRLRRPKNLSNNKSHQEGNKRLKLKKEGTELDWILKQADHKLLFYDSKQSIKPTDVQKADFDKLLKEAISKVELKSQLRVKGGKDYIDYVEQLLDIKLPAAKPAFSTAKYEFMLFDSIEEMRNMIIKKEKDVGLSRLVAGYAWEWKSKNNFKKIDIKIGNLKLRWNKASAIEWIHSDDAVNQVGCIHTTQGYDLNYTGVIFGNEISYDPDTKEINVIPKNYHDRYGKRGAKDSELKEYILNIYKTLMYRGIKGTFVYVCDENLREYFRRHIPVFKAPAAAPPALPESGYLLPNDKVKPFVNSVPFYDLEVAAGDFSPPQQVADCQWIKLPEGHAPNADHFVCRVVGESMNKKIANGSLCLFKWYRDGSRQNKIVLAEHYKCQESEFGGRYTVKYYHSEKEVNEESWHHTAITLKPSSFDASHPAIKLEESEVESLKVPGILSACLRLTDAPKTTYWNRKIKSPKTEKAP